jgi:hypothetical protein
MALTHVNLLGSFDIANRLWDGEHERELMSLTKHLVKNFTHVDRINLVCFMSHKCYFFDMDVSKLWCTTKDKKDLVINGVLFYIFFDPININDYKYVKYFISTIFQTTTILDSIYFIHFVSLHGQIGLCKGIQKKVTPWQYFCIP